MKTTGGLTREKLIRNKRGKIVSKRSMAHGLRMFKNIQSWVESVMCAREALHITKFVAINGQSMLGKVLYQKAKRLCAERDALTGL